jgi:hypothetical protein
MTKECEFGCECDIAVEFKPFDAVLGPVDLQRLILEKTMRAQRHIELQNKLGEQFDTN